MSEAAILDKLFNLNKEKPKQTYRIKQLDMSFTLQALSEQKIEYLRSRYQDNDEQKHVRAFNRALVAEATVAIDGDPGVTWKHPKLMERYKASSPEQVVKRVLLPGHILELADKVLRLSGYYDKATEEEEIKNSLEGEG